MAVGQARIGDEGLLNADKIALERIKRLGVRAALLGVARAEDMHYTQGPRRWDYINDHCRAYRGEFPRFGDCSAWVTGILWDATRAYPAARGARGDFVNGAGWESGHTGTLVRKGREVSLSRLRLLDLVFYGDEGWRPQHVAIYVGNGRVASFGSEAGPFLLPVRYRSDVAIGGWAPRRYVH